MAATFLANEINTTEGDITGPTAHVQIMFRLKDKKCRVLEDIFSGTYINKKSKKAKLCVIYTLH